MAHSTANRSSDRLRVVYSLPDGAQSGVLLRTALFRRLVAAEDIAWTFVSPLAADAEFAGEFAHDHVELRQWPAMREARWERLLLVLRQELWRRRIDNTTSRVFAQRLRWCAPLRYHVNRYVAPLLARIAGMERFLEWCDRRLASGGGWEPLLRDVRPHAVVLGSATVKPQETPLARAARRQRLPVFGVVPSWDNLTSKGLWARFDELAVWCESMRREAVELFGYSPANVVVTGPPPFDPHARPVTAADRARFFGERNLDPARRLLTYASVPKESCPFNRNYVELLAGLIRSDRLGDRCQLLVRMHPQDDPAQFHEVGRLPHVHVERAGGYSGEASGLTAILRFKPTGDDARRLTETLALSDVLINVTSTVTLEACGLDRPVVNIAFNLPADADFLDVGDYLKTRRTSPPSPNRERRTSRAAPTSWQPASEGRWSTRRSSRSPAAGCTSSSIRSATGGPPSAWPITSLASSADVADQRFFVPRQRRVSGTQRPPNLSRQRLYPAVIHGRTRTKPPGGATILRRAAAAPIRGILHGTSRRGALVTVRSAKILLYLS